MKPEAQRIAIAEACGWEVSPTWPQTPTHAVYRKGDELRITNELPDYLGDLNAMQSAVLSQDENFIKMFSTALSYRSFEQDERGVYLVYLAKLTNCSPSFATAAQRAEALLRTIGKWETP